MTPTSLTRDPGVVSPFPFNAVRDLLGILRVMRACARDDLRQHRAIDRIADELQAATEQAAESAPGTRAYAAAWERAERATAELGELVEMTTPLEPMLRAAGERVVSGIKAGRQRTRVALARGERD